MGTNRIKRAFIASLTARMIPLRARPTWHEVTKVGHYWLEADALADVMRVREDDASCDVGEAVR
jgi:hypothetical protein